MSGHQTNFTCLVNHAMIFCGENSPRLTALSGKMFTFRLNQPDRILMKLFRLHFGCGPPPRVRRLHKLSGMAIKSSSSLSASRILFKLIMQFYAKSNLSMKHNLPTANAK